MSVCSRTSSLLALLLLGGACIKMADAAGGLPPNVQDDDDDTTDSKVAKDRITASLAAVNVAAASYHVPSLFVRRAPDDTFEVLQWTDTQTVEHWRDQSQMSLRHNKPAMPTVLERQGMPKLFGTGMCVKFPPINGLLLPARPPRLPKPVKPLGGWQGPRPNWPVQPPAPALYAPLPHAGLERAIMVRLARKYLNYCVGMLIEEPDDATVVKINDMLAVYFACSFSTTPKSLSAKEMKAYCFHEVPLISGHMNTAL